MSASPHTPRVSTCVPSCPVRLAIGQRVADLDAILAIPGHLGFRVLGSRYGLEPHVVREHKHKCLAPTRADDHRRPPRTDRGPRVGFDALRTALDLDAVAAQLPDLERVLVGRVLDAVRTVAEQAMRRTCAPRQRRDRRGAAPPGAAAGR